MDDELARRGEELREQFRPLLEGFVALGDQMRRLLEARPTLDMVPPAAPWSETTYGEAGTYGALFGEAVPEADSGEHPVVMAVRQQVEEIKERALTQGNRLLAQAQTLRDQADANEHAGRLWLILGGSDPLADD